MLELLSTRVWALESNYYNSVKAVLLARMSEGQPALDPALAKPAESKVKYFAVGMMGDNFHSWEMSDAHVAALSNSGGPNTGYKVAVIPIIGPMTKRGGLCTRGTAEIGEALQSAYADPTISGIVLEFDTGGGAVDGTEALGNVINSRNKPVVAWVNGLAASAGYWAASQADSIVASSKSTAYVGSIGVLSMHVDQSQMLERSGIKVNILRSSKAVDKARMNSVEPLTDELLAEYTSQLDEIHDLFISTVKSGRAGFNLSDDNFTGKVYSGADAKKRGLVDSFGTLADAVQQVDKLSKSGQFGTHRKNSPTNKKATADTMLKFPKLAAFLGLNAETAANTEVTAEMMQSAEDRITALSTEKETLFAQVTTLKSEKAQLEKDKTTAEASLKEKEATIKAKEAEITTLEEYRKSQAKIEGKAEDESNKFDKKVTEKAAFEIIAEKHIAQAKAKK